MENLIAKDWVSDGRLRDNMLDISVGLDKLVV